MATYDLDDELSRLRPGKLLDEYAAEAQMHGSIHRATVGFYLRTTNRVFGRRNAPIKQKPKFAARAAKMIAAGVTPAALSTFHFRSSSVARPRSAPTAPGPVRRGERVAVYPSSSAERAIVLHNGGVYCNRSRAITVPSDRPFLKTEIGKYLQSKEAAVIRHYRLSSRSVRDGRTSPVDFQTYIDRADLPEEQRSKELESDRLGYISFGTLGETFEARTGFWKQVGIHESREGARLQSRIEAELPHWISPEDRREIARRFCALLMLRGLPYWCSVHLPGPKSDPRNFHMHVVWHDRPVIGHQIDYEILPDGSLKPRCTGPIFAPKKDPDVRKKHWIDELREKYAEIVNDVIEEHALRTNRSPSHLYFPGTNKALGINEPPQKHLGPRRSAIERNARQSSRGAVNDLTIRKQLSLMETQVIDDLLQNVRILGLRDRHGLMLSERAKSEADIREEVIASIYDAWHSCRGIRILEDAISCDKTPEALDALLRDLEQVGYIHPDKAILPPLPVIRGNYGQEEPPSNQIEKSNETFDEELVRRFGQVLATAHIYFLRRLSNASEVSWYLLHDNIDRARLPTIIELDDENLPELEARIRREDATAIQHIISVLRGEAPEKSNYTIYRSRKVLEIERAVRRSILNRSRTIALPPQIVQAPTTANSVAPEQLQAKQSSNAPALNSLARDRRTPTPEVTTQQRPSTPMRQSAHAVGTRRTEKPGAAEKAIVSTRNSALLPTQQSARGTSQIPTPSRISPASIVVDATNFEKFLFKTDVIRPKDSAFLVVRAKALKPDELAAAWRITLGAMQEADRVFHQAPSGSTKENRDAYRTGINVLDAEAKARGIDLQARHLDPVEAPHVGTTERGNRQGGQEH